MKRIEGLLAFGLVMMLVGSTWAERSDYINPTVTASYGQTPELDGVVNDAEWSDASSFAGFAKQVDLGEDGRAWPLMYAVPTPTKVWIKWDDSHLYLAFRAQRMKGVDLRAKAEAGENNQRVLREDAFELFIHPREDAQFFFVGNPNGALFDGNNKPGQIDEWDGGWTTDWQYRTHVTDAYWEGELAVPFEAMGVSTPREGQTWGFNATRYQPGWVRSAWSPIGGQFMEAAMNGTLRFSKTLQVAVDFPVVPLRRGVKLSLTNRGETAAQVSLRGGTFKVDASADEAVVLPDLQATFAFENEQVVFNRSKGRSLPEQVTLEPGAEQTWLAMLPAEPSDRFWGEVIAEVDGQAAVHQTVPMVYTEEAAIVVKQEKYVLTRGEIRLIVKGYSVGSSAVKYELTNDAGDIVATKAFAAGQQTDRVWDWDVRSIKPGSYRLTVAADGGSRTEIVTVPAKPDWMVNPVGDAGNIPPNFKPIAMDGRTLTFTFGQRLQFGDSILPQQVVSLFGNDVLAAPVRLIAEVAGESVPLSPSSSAMIEREGNRIVLEGQWSGSGLTVDGSAWVEFDGLTWFDLTVRSDEPITKFALEIPVRKDVAKLHRIVGPDLVDGSRVLRGAIPKEGIDSLFQPAVWVGDVEAGGIEWTAGSNEGWHNADIEKQLQVLPGDGATVVRINFIDIPTKLDEPVHYAFGLMPSPIRDPRSYNFWKDTAMIYTWSADPGNDKYFEPVQAEPGRMDFWFTGRRAPVHFRKGIVAAYPLAGNFDPRSGTWSMWVKLEPAGDDLSQTDLGYLDLGDVGVKLELVRDGKDWRHGRHTLRASVSGTDKQTINAKPVQTFDATKYHHVALSWESSNAGMHLALLLDGEKLGEAAIAQKWSEIDLANKKLFAGGVTQAVFDDIKITREAVDRIDLTQASRVTDTTLLQDRFEEDFAPNDFKQTRAAKISGQSAETGGWVDMWGVFVADGHSGRGLKLSTATTKDHFSNSMAAGATIFSGHYWQRKTFGQMWVPQNEAREVMSHKWMDATLQAGGVPCVYYLKNISPDDPAWANYGQEMLLYPPRMTINNYVVCPHGAGQDFLLWTMKQMIDRYDGKILSLHNDYGDVMACNALHHGCGWVDENGQTHKTWPVLAQRRMNQRIYSLFHTKDRHGFYKNHTSSGAVLASDGLADFYVTSEHEHRLPKHGRPIGEWLPDDEYLAFYSYWVTGVPSYGQFIHPTSILAGDGIHGMQTHLLERQPLINKQGEYDPYRRGGRDGIRAQTHALFPVLTAFADGRMMGFWKMDQFIRVAKSDAYADQFIRVSAWVKPGEALLVVGNLGSEPREVTLEPIFDALGLEGAVVASDAFTRQVYDAKAIGTNVGPENLRFIVLREQYTGRKDTAGR